VGARLIALAGGLKRMSMMPSSTIQVLGAEKALFRSLKTGTRPPKHGILFQHPDVHSARRELRGKISRLLANKIAVAARIDAFSGRVNPSLKEDYSRRLSRLSEGFESDVKA
jgi:nucleolar protein 56